MNQNLIRKLLSAIKLRVINTYLLIQSFLIAVITDKYWLLDWVPAGRADTQSIMLVRLDVIGDFVLWLDSARAYRRLFPDKKIVLYANSSWVELAIQLPHWDEVVSVDMVRLREDQLYRVQTFYRIRKRGFSVAIQPTYSREYMADMLTRSSCAKDKIGFDGDLSNILVSQKSISDCWYSRLIKTDGMQMMELTRNAAFVRSLGLIDFVSDIPRIKPLLSLSTNLQINTPYVVIFAGASWNPRRWSIENFALLIQILNDRYGLQCVLCGGPAEYELCRHILTHSHLNNVFNFAGMTKLTELVEVIRNAQFLFANETSAIHIAAAVDTPSVCLVGGGHYGRFLPYEIEQHDIHRLMPNVATHKMDCFNCNWQCVHIKDLDETVPCIKNITMQDVLAQYEAAIEN